MREWRKRGGEGVEREQMSKRARSAALWRLARLHYQEFLLLVEDEMRVERVRKWQAARDNGDNGQDGGQDSGQDNEQGEQA